MDELVKMIADELIRDRDESPSYSLTTLSKRILRAIDAAGWAVVPKKATDEMKLAGNEVIGDFTNYEYYGQAEMVCTAMLAAAPKLDDNQ